MSLMVGLACDYVFHLAEAYTHAKRHLPSHASTPEAHRYEATRAALKRMGMAVLGGALTTVLSSAILLLCTIQIFFKFGVIVTVRPLFLSYLTPLSSPWVSPSSTPCSSSPPSPCSGGHGAATLTSTLVRTPLLVSIFLLLILYPLPVFPTSSNHFLSLSSLPPRPFLTSC